MSPLLSSNRYSAAASVSAEPAKDGYRSNSDLMRMSHVRQVTGHFGTVNPQDRVSGIGLCRPGSGARPPGGRSDCTPELRHPAYVTGAERLKGVATRSD